MADCRGDGRPPSGGGLLLRPTKKLSQYHELYIAQIQRSPCLWYLEAVRGDKPFHQNPTSTPPLPVSETVAVKKGRPGSHESWKPRRPPPPHPPPPPPPPPLLTPPARGPPCRSRRSLPRRNSAWAPLPLSLSALRGNLLQSQITDQKIVRRSDANRKNPGGNV